MVQVIINESPALDLVMTWLNVNLSKDWIKDTLRTERRKYVLSEKDQEKQDKAGAGGKETLGGHFGKET